MKINVTCNFENVSLKNSKEKVTLDLTIDNKLSFNNHVNKICNKVSQKTCALWRISNYLDSKQKEIILKEMIRSQFTHCPLINIKNQVH